jgi:hypothetical protein
MEAIIGIPRVCEMTDSASGGQSCLQNGKCHMGSPLSPSCKVTLPALLSGKLFGVVTVSKTQRSAKLCGNSCLRVHLGREFCLFAS